MDEEIYSSYLKSHLKSNKKKKLQRGFTSALFVVLFIFFLFFCYTYKIIQPLALSYGESEVDKLLVTSCNNAILNISTIQYDDVVTINYSGSEISSIVINSPVVNNIANSLAIETQKEIELNSKLGVSIPIGTLSGITLLTGKGHKVTFIVNPIGRVMCRFYSSFENAGINQTSHKIYVTLDVSASLILPFTSKDITKQVDYLICECVIIGKVPDTYLSLSGK